MYRMISFIKGVAIGAGVMYFFDPVLGKRRRARMRDQLYSLANTSCDLADAKYRDLQNRLYGTFAELRSGLRHESPTDEVLVDRVRSQIGRAVSNARAIEVSACNGAITLSGPVLAREVNGLLSMVNSVRGVGQVFHQLDVHDAAGHIPALQGGPQQG